MDKPLFSYINWGLVVCIILLFGVGELNLYSASGARMGSGVTLSDFYQRQFIWGLCGLGCMLLTMSIDYHRLRSLAWPFSPSCSSPWFPSSEPRSTAPNAGSPSAS